MLHVLQLSSKDPTAADPLYRVETMSSIDVEEILDTDPPKHVEEFLDVTRDVVWNRRTFRGKGTDINESLISGLIPQSAKVGDLVCVLFGCSVPVVLRKRPSKGTNNCYELVGEAYVHGFMDGKGIRSLSPAALESAAIKFEIR
jgi:hypothetical protein